MEKARPRPAARADGRRGHASSAPASTSAATSPATELRDALRRGGARHGRDRRRATCPCPGASSTASTRRWSTSRRPTGSSLGEERARARSPPTGKDVVDHRRRRHRRRLPRHGASGRARASVTQLEILARPPADRPDAPAVADLPDDRSGSRRAHEEGGERVYAVSTQEFLGDDAGRVRALRLVEVESTTAFAAGRGHRARDPGRAGAARDGLHRPGAAGPGRAARRRARRARQRRPRRVVLPRACEGVFVAGDAGRGQSLIVWAIAEGRAAAAGGRPLPHRRDQPAEPDPAHGAAARRLSGGPFRRASGGPATVRVALPMS